MYLTFLVKYSRLFYVMKSCVFFGHRDVNYEPHRERIRKILIALIEREGITQFYSGNRGNFDRICSELVHELKTIYPQIRNTMILSYHPTRGFKLPAYYDDSVYLLERAIPRAYAILETNKRLVEIADIIVSGVMYDFGGAYKANEYARRKKKTIITFNIDK